MGGKAKRGESEQASMTRGTSYPIPSQSARQAAAVGRISQPRRQPRSPISAPHSDLEPGDMSSCCAYAQRAEGKVPEAPAQHQVFTLDVVVNYSSGMSFNITATESYLLPDPAAKGPRMSKCSRLPHTYHIMCIYIYMYIYIYANPPKNQP